MAETFSLKRHRARAAKAKADDVYYQWMQNEAYRYAIPLRKPSKWGKGENRIDNLFDDTAITSTFKGAGDLKEDLFPSGEPFFKLEPGPVARLLAEQDGENAARFSANLGNITDQILPFFQTGEFDQAVSEVCIDLYAGTGALLPLAGENDDGVDFVCIPADELAIENGPRGRIGAAYWTTKMSRRSIAAQFKKGKFPEEFTKELEGDGAEVEIEISQDFIQEGKYWYLYVYINACGDADPPVFKERYRTQPIIIARYHKVPGETKGRGPINLTLPAIKTANKSQELALKAFAIQMLGIWGYRPGGAFNPDVNRLSPGAFWPMNSTAGILGPDVTRLDPATGRIDLTTMVTQNLTERIRAGLHDDQIESKGKTPVSASEYVGSLNKLKKNYIGAFGRMVHELVPPLVLRVMEILYGLGLLQTDLKPDALFVRIKVTSPMAAAMKASHLKPLFDYFQILQALAQNPARFLHLDKLLDDLRDEMNIKGKYQVTRAEREKIDKATAQQQAGAAVTEALVKKPEIVANALNPQQQQQPAAP